MAPAITKLPGAPSPRPAKAFSSEKAQQWVLASAIIVAVSYTFRRLVEPSVSTAPAKGSKTARMLGAGSPPPPLGTWVIAFGAGFGVLAVMAIASPELAASLAAMTAVGTLLTNGLSLVHDVAALEAGGADQGNSAFVTAVAVGAETAAGSTPANAASTATAQQKARAAGQ